MIKISIIYLTNRQDPKFEWFVDSLYNQTTMEQRTEIELIFVDSVLQHVETRREAVKNIVGQKFRYNHILPKDNIYQGNGRKTMTEFFAPSNARNTGAAAAQGEYIVFVDDVSVLMPGWFNAVANAAQERLIVCGAYQKHWQMIVEHGKLLSSESKPGGVDSRWNQGTEERAVLIAGGQLFGCSFGISKDIFNSVDGFDEICDSIGGEDYHLGIRLNNAGHKIYYLRAMLTIESEELHAQPFLMLRQDRLATDEAYMKKLAYYGVTKRTVTGRPDSSHMILDILYGSNQKQSIGINYANNGHWFDDAELSKL